MKIEYFHHSVFGNGVLVAEEFKKLMVARGVTVNVHHIREVSPTELPPADLYLFSSPGRRGKPIKDMRRFLRGDRIARGNDRGRRRASSRMRCCPSRRPGRRR